MLQFNISIIISIFSIITTGGNTIQARQKLTPETCLETDAIDDMAIAQGEVFTSKADLLAALRAWLEDTDGERLADVAYGQARWLKLECGGMNFWMNANTKRSAIADLVAHGEGAWMLRHTKPKRRDAVQPSGTRVVVLDVLPTPGLYLYLRPRRGEDVPETV